MTDLLRDLLSTDIGTSGRGGILMAVPLVLTAASLLVSRRRPESEKVSPYECGFEPVGDARVRFDTFYYTVGILFLLFDLEIVLLLPYALNANGALDGPLPLGGALALLLLLTLGFIYEWTRGALKTLRLPGGHPSRERAHPSGGGVRTPEGSVASRP